MLLDGSCDPQSAAHGSRLAALVQRCGHLEVDALHARCSLSPRPFPAPLHARCRRGAAATSGAVAGRAAGRPLAVPGRRGWAGGPLRSSRGRILSLSLIAAPGTPLDPGSGPGQPAEQREELQAATLNFKASFFSYRKGIKGQRGAGRGEVARPGAGRGRGIPHVAGRGAGKVLMRSGAAVAMARKGRGAEGTSAASKRAAEGEAGAGAGQESGGAGPRCGRSRLGGRIIPPAPPASCFSPLPLGSALASLLPCSACGTYLGKSDESAQLHRDFWKCGLCR